MRKIALILVFSLMLCNSISAEDLLHYFDTSRIEESAEKNSNIDFSNLFNNIITGNFDEVKSDIIDNVKELFLENLQKNISNIKLLCVICLLIGLFKNAVNGIEEKGIYEIVSFIGQILILSIAIIAFKEMIGILKEVAVSIIDIIDSAIPLMIGVISLNGNTVHAAGVYAILMFVTERLLYIIDGIIIPLISTGTLIRIVNLLSKKEMLSKMSDLFSFITNGLIKIGAFAFVALLTLTTIFPLPTDIICTFVRNLLTKMTENRSYLQKYAMHFGTYMGIYWILKFILFPLGFHIPFLSLLFVILTLAVPFIGYHYVKMYRDKICGGSIQFSHAVLFTIFMYMFASLLVAVAHYAYFQFIDHGFIINSYIQLWDELMTKTPALMENQEIIKETIDTARSLTSINITMQLLSWDVFWGSLLAIPTGLMVMKKARPENNTPAQS